MAGLVVFAEFVAFGAGAASCSDCPGTGVVAAGVALSPVADIILLNKVIPFSSTILISLNFLTPDNVSIFCFLESSLYRVSETSPVELSKL